MSTLIKVVPYTYQPLPALNLDLSPNLAKRLFFISDKALKQGAHIMAGPGSGKSRFLGRVLVWQALTRGLPTVVFDPTGEVANNILDKLSRLPPAIGQQLAARLLYVDAGAKEHIVPTPLYRRHSASESYEEIGKLIAIVFEQEDPNLERAPLMGGNSLKENASYGGQIAAVLGLQIDFVDDLVRHPGRYKDLLDYALAQQPDLHKAVAHFRALMDPSNRSLRERTASFLNKLHPFLSDRTVRATFAAPTPGIDWERVVHTGQTVLVDFREEWDAERRQFKMLWWLKDFTLFGKYRGTAGRGQEVMLVIDELTQLLGYRIVSGESILAGDIEELTTAHGRNFGINVVIAHQNLQQIDKRIQAALMQMGNQFIGRMAHPDDALLLARYFLTYDPHKVKKQENQWIVLDESAAFFLDPKGRNINNEPYAPLSMRKIPFLIDRKSIEFTPQEQFLILADQLRNLNRFQFYLRPASTEGQIDNRLYLITLAHLDLGVYPDIKALGPIRDWLRQQSGVPVDKVLAEIAAQQKRVLIAARQAKPQRDQAQGKALSTHDKIGRPTAHATNNNSLRNTAPQPPDEDDDFWQEIPPHEHPLNPA
jgi:hypothetical protein